jgi:N-acetylglutamate synthase-like GNAT family acetyltransferase
VEEKYYISEDKNKIDVDFVHDYLSNQSYWAKGRSRLDVLKTIKNSLCFSVFNRSDTQIGFARVISDMVVIAYIMDVFIVEENKGKGIGKDLIRYIVNHPDLKNVTEISLKTKDAHSLYKKLGFELINDSEMRMIKNN